MSGANGWLEASDNGSITAVNTFSLSLEFRQDINGSGGLLFGKHPLPFSGNTLEISVLLLNANRLLFAVGPLAAQSQAFLIGPTVTRGVWHTVRASWEVATGRLALEYDGMLMEKNATVLVMNTGQPIRIGNTGENTRQFLGLIEQVKVFNSVIV